MMDENKQKDNPHKFVNIKPEFVKKLGTQQDLVKKNNNFSKSRKKVKSKKFLTAKQRKQKNDMKIDLKVQNSEVLSQNIKSQYKTVQSKDIEMEVKN